MNALSVFTVMDLATRFAMVRLGQLIKVHQMRIGVAYIIFAAETVTTRLGTTVAVHLHDPETAEHTFCISRKAMLRLLHLGI
jgi:hypothetical protein